MINTLRTQGYGKPLLMPDSATLLVFISAATIILFTPGPAVLYIVTKSIDQGTKAGMCSVYGIALGTSSHVIAAAFGLTALLVSSVILYDIVRFLGAAYLFYLGIQKIFFPGKSSQSSKAGLEKTNHVFLQSTLVGILNPKAALFFLAFVTQFVDTTSESALAQILILGLIWEIMGMVVGLIYSIIAGSARGWLSARHRLFEIPRFLVGGVYIALGIAAAFSSPTRR